jgi:hypothetical protein
MTYPDPNRFRGRLKDYLAWAADGFRPTPLWCVKHWVPCPVEGKPGLLVTIILQTELMSQMPADVGDATGMNSWQANRVTPLCCELGDELMAWLWEEVDAPHCGVRPPAGHRWQHGRVCWYRPGHLFGHEWDNPGSIFALRPGGAG